MPQNPVLEFVRKLDASPQMVRRSFVASSVRLTQAENAHLLLASERDPISWKKNGARSAANSLTGFHDLNRKFAWAGTDFLVLLSSPREKIGALLLHFQRKKRRDMERLLDPLCRIYVLWEEAQQLCKRIQTQQQVLQELTRESTTVARDYVRLSEQMRANQNRLQSITKGILRTQEEERAKISRDLHDGIGQELTALKMNLDIIAPAVEPHLEAEEQGRWIEARAITEQALQDVRELSRLLRPRMLDDLGLFPTLRWYVRSFSKRVNITVDLKLYGDEEKLNPEKQTIVYRIVQEALNNVAKHSRAASAQVWFKCGEQEAELVVRDDGVGFDTNGTNPESGSGLAGMRDRVQLYNGKFFLQSAPSRGTELKVILPV